MIAILLAGGFEEIEALTPLDILRRAGLDARTVAVGNKIAVGSHGISVICDMTEDEVNLDDLTAVIFPGGMPGSLNLDASAFSDKVIDAVLKNNGIIAAICAAPLVLGRRGLLNGKRAVCYPGFEKELKGATVESGVGVVTDGNIITARGMGVATDFALAIVEKILGKEKADEISAAILYNKVDEVAEDEPEVEEVPSFLGLKWTATPVEEDADDEFDFGLPPIDILNTTESEPDVELDDGVAEMAENLLNALEQFNVSASIKGVDVGPRFTRFEVAPAKGVRLSRIMNLAYDIGLYLSIDGIRIETPTAGKTTVGIEIPNKYPSVVYMHDLIEEDEFKNEPSKTFACIGKDVSGNPVYADVSKMPHLLVAGATGMGKSVCMNSIITSILYKATPDEVKFILIDPKAIEFSIYKGIPNLLVPVITDVFEAAGALSWAIDEMNRRYELMAKNEVRRLDSYNELVLKNPALGKPLPKIIIVIDELSDLMMQARNPVEGLILSITQKARAAGIHLIIGTQRPSVDVITGVIKANIPSRISFRVSTSVDSRTVLDQSGAEKLLDKGDMLFTPVGKPSPIHVQGAFVSDNEVEKMTDFLRENASGYAYDKDVIEEIKKAAAKYSVNFKKPSFDEDEDEDNASGYLNDEQFLRAVEIAIEFGKVSTSLIQRKVYIGYGKAAKFIDMMEDLGVVSAPCGTKPRDVLITKEEWDNLLNRK